MGLKEHLKNIDDAVKASWRKHPIRNSDAGAQLLLFSGESVAKFFQGNPNQATALASMGLILSGSLVCDALIEQRGEN